MDTPSMDKWEAAWLAKNVDQLKNLYADNAVVIPPNQVGYRGPEEIINFFGGGVGTIKVTFNAEETIISDTLAYEFGTVKDYTLDSGELFEMTKYAITYAKIDDGWRILFHTWTVKID
ncbi:MAG: nuclear transport factor 2 family protein [Chloroflexota bacterium]